MGTPDGKRLLGRSTSGWEGNIKASLQETQWRVDWADLLRAATNGGLL